MTEELDESDECRPLSSRAVSLDAALDDDDQSNDSNDDASLAQRFGALLSSEDMADVHFVVGAPQGRPLRIPAHRLVLAVASPVFRRALYDDAAEEVVVGDMEAIVFLELLRFVYTDQIRLQKDNVVGLLSAAKKYAMPALERRCARFVRQEICADNALAIWAQAKTGSEAWVAALAARVVRRFAATALLGPDFCRLSTEAVVELLKDDLLRVQEVDVFVAVTRWAKQECLRRGQCPTRVQMRRQMAEAVDWIRFPLMSSQQLRTVVQSEGVLDDDVMRALLQRHHSWPRKALPFPSTPRAYQRLRGALLSVQRFASFDNQLPNPRSARSLRFAVNRRVFVAGVGVYGPRRPAVLQISVRIARCGRQEAPLVDESRKSVRIKTDSSAPVITVKLDDEFEVEPNVEHEVWADVALDGKSGHFFYGTNGHLAAKVRTQDGPVIFNFAWDNQCGATARSAPPTPNPPPPRPPPPVAYRRPSRLARLKRALSFTEKTGSVAGEEAGDVDCGQIPVILFFA